MKYIKLFESNENFLEVDRSEFINLLHINIEPNAKKKIEDWCQKYKYNLYGEHKLTIVAMNIIKLFEADIFQADDEWFSIRLFLNKNIIYYKCDQIEGLIDCLNYIKETKFEFKS